MYNQDIKCKFSFIKNLHISILSTFLLLGSVSLTKPLNTDLLRYAEQAQEKSDISTASERNLILTITTFLNA